MIVHDVSKGNWITRPATSVALRYGLALVSVATALGLAYVFLYFDLPQPFAAFALSAIAITFWYGGAKPGILAAVVASIARSYFFESRIDVASRFIYNIVFAIFALLMLVVLRARDELESRVAERTRQLTATNEELRHSQAYLAEAQRLSQTGSFGWKISTGEILWSEETFRIFEYDPTTTPTLDLILQRVHPEDAARFNETNERASREGEDFELEYRLVMPNGVVKHVHVVAHAERDDSGGLEFVGAVMDVTDRKRSEEELRRSEGYLAEAQRLSHTGSWASRPAMGEITYFSEECYRVLGFDPFDGKPPYETFSQRIHPDDQAKLREAVETAWRKKSEFELDYRIVHPGGEIRDIHVVGHPVVSPSGDLVEFVGTVMDVTERKQAEEERERLRQAQVELAHINRVTTMGELTASLAHEVNQPIAAAVTDANTCLRWLRRDEPDLEEARQAAERVVQGATRAGEIIRRVRLIFKKGAPQHTLVDLNELIREMVILLRTEATRYCITVRTELSELPQVSGDRVQLQQVLMNLMTNSIDAMKGVKGTRELIIRSHDAEDGQVLISVADTGVGIPSKQANQIFDAFFTTKSQGTGMGLRISRSIVESHSGKLWSVDNKPRGAIFNLMLPTNGGVQE